MSEVRRGLQPGDGVIVRQISDAGVGLTIREIGAGVLAEAPEVGRRLRIELRRGRGLASSPVTHMEELGEGQLAVKTEGRVYVLCDMERARAGRLGRCPGARSLPRRRDVRHCRLRRWQRPLAPLLGGVFRGHGHQFLFW